MNPGVTINQAYIERRSIPVPFAGCWLWLGIVDRHGYAIARQKPTWLSGHRASWIAHNGPIPDGLQVLHRCDIPSCVNPDHLWLGTPKDNAADRDAKGRHRNSSPKTRSGVGATYVPSKRKWQAQRSINGKSHYLGLFDTKAEASAAYRAAAPCPAAA